MTSIHLSFYRALYAQEYGNRADAESDQRDIDRLSGKWTPPSNYPTFTEWLAERCARAERRLERFEAAARTLVEIVEEGR